MTNEEFIDSEYQKYIKSIKIPTKDEWLKMTCTINKETPKHKSKSIDKKYKMTDKTTSFNGRTFHRIVALRDFDCVKKGDKGGWIESENNLSHDGNCWVSGYACVYDKAHVCGNARVGGIAYVSGSALICDNALIIGVSSIGGNARICDNAIIKDNAVVEGKAVVCGNEVIGGNTVKE